MPGSKLSSFIFVGIPAAIVLAMAVYLLLGGEADGRREIADLVDTPIVHAWRGERPDDLLGHTTLAGADLNGDGVPDVLSGAAGPPRGGSVSAFSGKDGSRIWGPQVADVRGDAGFGTSLAYVEDRDGDGVPEVAAGAPGDGAGVAFLLSGRTGLPLLRIDGKRMKERFGDRVLGLDDLDGDGHGDLAVAASATTGDGHRGVIRLVSSMSGETIRELELAGPSGDRLGFAMVAIPDQDGDGLRDLAASAIGIDEDRGAILAFSSGTGRELWRRLGDASHDVFGHDVDLGGDLSGDGRPELLVSAFNEYERSYLLALDCRTGEIVRRFESGAKNGLGHSIAGCGDMNGDGVPDIAAGAPNETLFGCYGVGSVHVLSGKDGSLLGKLEGAHDGGRFGYDIHRIGDLDGDGRCEIVIGSCIAQGRVGRLVVSKLR